MAYAIFVVLVLACSLQAAEKRGITAEDYFAFRVVADPHLSPDGKQAVYVQTSIDQKKNRRDSSIWLVAVDGSAPPRRLSAEGFSSSSPRWSPDGKTLAFLSSRNVDGSAEAPHPQVFLMSMAGGEALPLTKLKNGVSVFQWSPDGSRLACVGRAGPSDAIPTADRKSDVRHYTHIQYKFNDTGWFDDKRSHLWTVDAKTGKSEQITKGDDWNDTDPQWSPDGTRIAFVSDRTGKAYDDSHNTDVWVIPANGGDLIKISDHPFEDHSPRWSPDGARIVFAGQTKRRQFAKLYVASSSGGSPSQLAVADLDLIPGEMQWGATDHELLFSTGVKAETHIFRADLSTRKISQVTSGERAVHTFDINRPTNEMVYLSSDFEHMDDLFIADRNGQGERQLTHVNAHLWEDLNPQPVERVSYKSTDGWPIDGFLVKPRG